MGHPRTGVPCSESEAASTMCSEAPGRTTRAHSGRTLSATSPRADHRGALGADPERNKPQGGP
eukprot:2240129-Alexandrium_andersonii.AAC.1